MTINIDITREDYWEFNKFVWFKNRFGFKKIFVPASIIGLGVVIAISLNKPFDIGDIAILAILYYLVYFAIYGLYSILTYHSLRQTVKKYPDKDGSILGRKEYTISEEGFREVTEASEMLTKWKGIQKVEETEKHIFIFIDKISAFIIPKRYLPTSSCAELIKILRERTERGRNEGLNRVCEEYRTKYSTTIKTATFTKCFGD